MSAKFEELFLELERALPEGLGGLQLRRIHPEGVADLFVAVANPERRRAVILELEERLANEIELRDDVRGLEVTVRRASSGPWHVVVTLVDPAASDIFIVLAADIAQSAAKAEDAATARDAFLGRLSRWRHLLAKAPRGLSPERQRGLFAEIWIATEHLIPRIGVARAVEAWSGPLRGVRDFEGSGGALEVKSSASNQPQVARINGERQLDDSGLPMLLLAHVSLDVHRDQVGTLPEAVAELRAFADAKGLVDAVDERLLSAGYHDMHSPRYQRTGYKVLRFDLFHVRDGFPRILDRDLPSGVGGLTYDLAIAACNDFLTPPDTLTTCPILTV